MQIIQSACVEQKEHFRVELAHLWKAWCLTGSMQHLKHTVAPEIMQVCFILKDPGFGFHIHDEQKTQSRYETFRYETSTLARLCLEETPAEA